MKKSKTRQIGPQKSWVSRTATRQQLPSGGRLNSTDRETLAPYAVTEDVTIAAKRTIARVIRQAKTLRAMPAESAKKEGYRKYGLHGQATRLSAHTDKQGANYRVFKSAPSRSASQIAADMDAIKAMLRRLVRPEAVEGWLNKAIPLLGHRTPAEAIRGGEAKKVIEVLARVEGGIHL